jgi:DNA polymerase-4
MKQRIVLHIDMNSYFASVEQQANPFLRGKPVGVCAYLSPGGVIIASSIEAKAKGIKTGCKVRDALQLDPKVVLLENEPAKYRSTTEKIFNIIQSYTERVEPYSIDEAFLDLTGQPTLKLRQASWDTMNWDSAEFIGKEIQARIKNEVGDWLSASVGISWTKFLAKFAGDITPKKTVLVIDDEDKLNSILQNRPLQDAWGINYRMEARLNSLGIRNLWDLKKFDKDKIRRALGRYGYYLWSNVNGLEIAEVSQGTVPPKSIGHSYCLAMKTTDKDYLSTVLFKLCEKTGRRLRAKDLEAQVIHIGWAYTRAGGIHKSFKTPDKLFTTEEIFRHSNCVLEDTRLFMPVRMMAVSVTSLIPVTSQMSLFEDNLSIKNLSRAVDKINDKYGEFTVVRGQMFNTDSIARDRVGFRKTVEI